MVPPRPLAFVQVGDQLVRPAVGQVLKRTWFLSRMQLPWLSTASIGRGGPWRRWRWLFANGQWPCPQALSFKHCSGIDALNTSLISFSSVCLYDAVSDLMHNWVPQRPDFKSALGVIKMVLNAQFHLYIIRRTRIWISWAKLLAPGQLVGYPWKLWGITVQTSYVEGRWHQNWAYTSPKLFFYRRTRKSVKNGSFS